MIEEDSEQVEVSNDEYVEDLGEQTSQEESEPALEDTGIDTAESEPDEQPPRQQSRRDKRIDGLTADKHQLRGQLDATQRQLAEARARMAQQTPPPVVEPDKVAPVAPNLDDHDGDYDSYLKAQTKWTQDLSAYSTEQATKQVTEFVQRNEEQRIAGLRQAEVSTAWQENVYDAKGKYSDFEVVAENPSLQVTNEMAAHIQGSEVGTDILYYLGKNPDRAARIAQMTPQSVAMEIGKISGALQAGSSPRATGGKKVSRAPAPATPTRSRTDAPERDPTKMSQSEYNAWRAGGGGA